MPPDNAADNAEIRRLRTDAGPSQKQLAAQVSYIRQYVSLVERIGGTFPSLELVRALDARLNAGSRLGRAVSKVVSKKVVSKWE